MPPNRRGTRRSLGRHGRPVPVLRVFFKDHAEEALEVFHRLLADGSDLFHFSKRISKRTGGEADGYQSLAGCRARVGTVEAAGDSS